MLKLRDLLNYLGNGIMVEILEAGNMVSNGAYFVEELLEKNSEILERTVSEKSIEIHVEVADELVAHDSKERDEFFRGECEICYLKIIVNAKEEEDCMKDSHICRYRDTDKLQYVLMEIMEGKEMLIAAEEFPLFDRYLDYANNEDKEVVIDFNQPDREPYKLVYGGMLLNVGVTYEKALEISSRLAGYALYDLEETRVNVSGYEAIEFYPEDALSENYIPFVALMKTCHKLQDMSRSITMFPAMEEYRVWEAMVNRPFVLACREAVLVEGVSVDNWKRHIDRGKLMEVYQKADLIRD